jgi:hypothetical protein
MTFFACKGVILLRWLAPFGSNRGFYELLAEFRGESYKPETLPVN